MHTNSLVEKFKLNRYVFITVINYKTPSLKCETSSSRERRSLHRVVRNVWVQQCRYTTAVSCVLFNAVSPRAIRYYVLYPCRPKKLQKLLSISVLQTNESDVRMQNVGTYSAHCVLVCDMCAAM